MSRGGKKATRVVTIGTTTVILAATRNGASHCWVNCSTSEPLRASLRRYRRDESVKRITGLPNHCNQQGAQSAARRWWPRPCGHGLSAEAGSGFPQVCVASQARFQRRFELLRGIALQTGCCELFTVGGAQIVQLVADIVEQHV